jgi:hypothetical protein
MAKAHPTSQARRCKLSSVLLLIAAMTARERFVTKRANLRTSTSARLRSDSAYARVWSSKRRNGSDYSVCWCRTKNRQQEGRTFPKKKRKDSSSESRRVQDISRPLAIRIRF